jgi:hypothetical protein
MKKKILLLSLCFSILFANSCTDLEEEVLDESFTRGATPEAAADGIIAPVYAAMPELLLHTRYFALQEISTDEAILPFRGGKDWGDNNIYIDLHRHNTTPQNAVVNDTWRSLIITGVTRAISAINQLNDIDTETARTYLAEAKAMHAYYSMLSLDLFGLIFVKDNLAARSTILRGNEAVEFIKNELLSVQNDVSNSVGPGRVTQGAVWGLLAKLHLNAAIYRDPYADNFNFTNEDMDKVIEYTDKVIASGQYQLSPEYFEIFDDENHTNKELIFALDQRAELNGHNRMAYFSLSGDQFPLPQFPKANGTDGPAITPDFYHTWTDAYGVNDPADMDSRFYKKNLVIPSDSCLAAASFEIDRGILRGQQYGLQTPAYGTPFVRCGEGGSNYKIGKLFSRTRGLANVPVNFTESVDYSEAGRGYNTGYRVLKYEFSKKSDTGRNKGDADIIILRLADIYMMRAEAKLRKGNAADALTDVNTVRSSRTARTTPPALGEMDLDILFRERGFEFYWEMQRRTDMIRFGKYEGSWTEKTDADKRKRLFPIPQSAIDGASEIAGYLEQNAGY